MADLGRFQHRHDPEAVHHSLQRFEWLDLGDNHIGPHPARPHCNALAAPPVAADDEVFARQQNIGGTDDAVDRALAGAVAVVKKMFGLGVVDSHHRKGQFAGCCHGPQPDHTGRGLLRAPHHRVEQVAALGMQHGHQIHPVVHGDVGLDVEHAVEVAVVLGGRLPLDGKDRHLVVGHKRSGNVVLGAQRVGGGQSHLGPPSNQHTHQVGRLRRHMHGCSHPDAFERLLFFEAFFDQIEHRHLFGRPLHAEPPAFRQLDIGDIMRSFLVGDSHHFSP